MTQRLLAAIVALVVTLAMTAPVSAERRHPVHGMVLQIDPAARTFVVSHEAIPGVMDAMTMAFAVREAKDLDGLVPGVSVTFTWIVERESAYATAIRVRPYVPVEQDPLAASRLSLLRRVIGGANRPAPLAIGDRVPELSLIDQHRRPVVLSALRGRTVAVNFIYTRCALPQFCARLTNDFSVLQSRFRARLGSDLVLLTITFDPQRDDPDALARYAERWQADGTGWRFLTSAVADVHRVAALFGVDHFPEEGQMNHSLRTAVIDAEGRLVANIEGNRFTPEQLGDLVQSVLDGR